MYKVFLFIISVLLCFSSGLGSATPIFDQERENNSYYWGSIKTIFIRSLAINTNYSLLIGSNQPVSEQQWINYTATAGISKITFKHDSEAVDVNGTTLDYLIIQLFNSDTNVLQDFLTLSIIYPPDQYNPEKMVSMAIIILTMLVIGFVVIAFAKWR